MSGDILFEIHILNTSKFLTFTDQRDGEIYKSVKIRSQVWMAENLNYESAAGSWCYGNNSSNCEKYGRLYTWEIAKTVCPTGWHLPSDEEWTVFSNYLGGENIAGDNLKSHKTMYNLNIEPVNDNSFSSLSAGARNDNETFYNIGIYGYWWSSSECSRSNAWYRFISSDNKNVFRFGSNKFFGYSVRCVRD